MVEDGGVGCTKEAKWTKCIDEVKIVFNYNIGSIFFFYICVGKNEENVTKKLKYN